MDDTRLNTTPEATGDGRDDPTPGPQGNAPAPDLERQASHRPAETSPSPRQHRPLGHVFGHAIGEPPPPPRGNRPLGHVVGRETHMS
jgi:hypothetical protein